MLSFGMHPSSRHITKSDFLNCLVCPTLGWYAFRDMSKSAPSPGELLRMSEGKRIGLAARLIYSGGVLVSEPSSKLAIQTTNALLNDEAVPAIFEATFKVGRFIAKADVLVRCDNGWQLIEVKSGIREKEEYLLDLAYTAFVMTKAGKPSVASLLQLVNRDYRYGQPEAELLAEPIDLTKEVQDLVTQYESLAPDIERKLLAETRPEPKLMRACRTCPYFEAECIGKGIEHHILQLPRLRKKTFDDFLGKNISSIADIPDDYHLGKTHAIIRQSIYSSAPHFDAKAIRKRLDDIKWPVAYLDFESLQTAIPRFPTLAPYQQMATQFSIHHCDSPGNVTGHYDFLADAGSDCREFLVQQLLIHLEKARTILVYSPFEKTVLTQLAIHFPAHSESLHRIIDKLFDLLTVLKPQHYYHPELKGSYSIKSVLPVLVPGYSYDKLAIQNGQDAIAMFVRIVDGRCTPEEASVIRSNLLEYCKLDTLAMVKLHHQLELLAS